MREILLKNKIAVLAVLAIIILVSVSVTFSEQRPHSSATAQEKIATLKELRDSGVISEQDYQSKAKALSSSPAPSAHAQPVSWSSTRKVEVVDPQYQMTALTLDIPSGWKFAGTVARPEDCHANGAALKFTSQSADGLTGWSQLPGVQWTWSSSPSKRKIMASQGCPSIDIESAAAFLVNIAVPNLSADAQIISVDAPSAEEKANLDGQLEKQQQQNAAMARQYGQAPMKLSLDGARVRIEYERAGQMIDESVWAVVGCSTSHYAAMFAQPAFEERSCYSRSTVILRAPHGRLDEQRPHFKSLVAMARVNDDWQIRVASDQQATFNQRQAKSNRDFEGMLKKGREQNDALLANGRAQNAARQEQTDHAMANDRAKQNAIDASAHATALHALDRQDFINPSTGQKIEASSQYNHQWMSSDGSTLIQTDDHSYDPNGEIYINQSWTELVPK